MLYEREDWTLFRNLPTLAQKAGVAQEDLPRVVAKELADNALDAAGWCKINLSGENGFYVQDDGPGLDGTDEEIAHLFSIARPLTSSKLLRLPTRGALGNGLRVVAGAVLATHGLIYVVTRGRVLELVPQDDGTTRVQHMGSSSRAGTIVDVRFGSSLMVTDECLGWAELASRVGCGPTYQGKTSPHWYDAESFWELLQAAKDRPLRAVIAEFDGCSSNSKASGIAASFLGRPANSLTREEADAVLARAQSAAREVSPARLGRIGDTVALPGSYASDDGVFHLGASRGRCDAAIPYVVEAWVDSDAERVARNNPEITVCINKSPVTATVSAYYDRKDKSVYVGGCGLDHVINDVSVLPASIFLNVQVPYIPIISDGKAPDLVYVFRTVRDVIQKAARKAKSEQARARKLKRACSSSECVGDEKHARWQEAAVCCLGRKLQPKTLELWDALDRVMQSYAHIRVRAAGYRLVDMKVIEKTEKEFNRVGRALTDMRRAGIVPYEKIVEGHRERVKIQTFDDLADFLGKTKNAYRRDVWATHPHRVEVFIEKDGLADIVAPICNRYRVHYVAVKGMSSVTLLYNSAEEMKAAGKKTIILYFGDLDPTGVSIPSFVERELAGQAADFELRRIAVTKEQIKQYGLPTRPPKSTDNKHRAFTEEYGNECVEVDALEAVGPDLLPSLIEDAICELIDEQAWQAEMEMEEKEQRRLARLIDALYGQQDGDAND